MAEAALMILVGMLLGLLAAVTTLFVYLLMEAYDKEHNRQASDLPRVTQQQTSELQDEEPDAYSYNKFRTILDDPNYYRAVRQMQHQTGSMYVG